MKRYHPWLSWPQIRDAPMQVACHLCDTLQLSPRLKEGDAAYCCHCGERLYRNRAHSLARATSFSSAGLIFMVLAHMFPFLTMSSGSMRTRLTLAECALVLVREGDFLVALGVVFFTIVSPLILVGGLFYVAAPLRYGLALPGAIKVTRWVQQFEPWSMLEVFLLGLIVSLMKLGKMAEMDFGTGLWALGGLVFCTAAAVGGIDRLELWDRLEITQQQQQQSAESHALPPGGEKEAA